MKNKTERDVIEMFHRFQQSVLDNKPSFREMCEDVRMMRFKVRPVQGDIAELNFKNISFIETLWSLGKLDEFYQEHVDDLTKKEKQVFYTIFDGLYHQYQEDLNLIDLKSDTFEKVQNGFEVEIFRERSQRDN